jgi:hypothetical protein
MLSGTLFINLHVSLALQGLEMVVAVSESEGERRTVYGSDRRFCVVEVGKECRIAKARLAVSQVSLAGVSETFRYVFRLEFPTMALIGCCWIIRLHAEPPALCT